MVRKLRPAAAALQAAGTAGLAGARRADLSPSVRTRRKAAASRVAAFGGEGRRVLDTRKQLRVGDWIRQPAVIKGQDEHIRHNTSQALSVANRVSAL